MRLSYIIKRPILTEKSMAQEVEDKYIFSVSMKATKGAIVDEMKRMYNVDVINVATMIMPGKKRRLLKTRRFLKTAKWKKAIVKLKKGQKIDLVSN